MNDGTYYDGNYKNNLKHGIGYNYTHQGVYREEYDNGVLIKRERDSRSLQ
jgi:hypothetical protein